MPPVDAGTDASPRKSGHSEAPQNNLQRESETLRQGGLGGEASKNTLRKETDPAQLIFDDKIYSDGKKAQGEEKKPVDAGVTDAGTGAESAPKAEGDHAAQAGPATTVDNTTQPEPAESSKPDGSKTPELWDKFGPEGVKQGANGDCFLESTIAALANSEKGREQLKSMVKTNEDGSWTVTFPGAKNEPINVKPEDLDTHKTRADQAQWARVIETAGLKYQHNTPITGGIQTDGISPFGRATSMRGAMQLLTGQDEATDNLVGVALGSRNLGFGATSKENVARDLEDAFKNGNPVTAGVSPEFAKYIGGNSAGPLPEQHAYTVTGYDAKTKTVTVRNPWGTMDNTGVPNVGDTKDGITNIGEGNVSMSLDTFYSHFANVEFGNKSSVQNAATNVIRTGGDYVSAQVSAANNLAHGDIKGAAQDMLDAKQHAQNFVHESIFAGTSTIWHNITDHPLESINPTLLPILAAENAGIVPPVLPGAGEAFTTATRGIQDGAEKAKELGGAVISFGRGLLGG